MLTEKDEINIGQKYHRLRSILPEKLEPLHSHDKVYEIEYWCPHTTPCGYCRSNYKRCTCNLNLDAHSEILQRRYGYGHRC